MTVAVIGNPAVSEFQPALEVLRRYGVLAHFAHPAEVSTAPIGEPPPELVVVLQSRPDEFAWSEIARLLQTWPLARLVTVLSSWFEGEIRSGDPWPGAVRLYWHHAASRLERELQRQAENALSSWQLPVTATPAERVLAMADAPLPAWRGEVVVYSPDPLMSDWLARACRLAGATATIWSDCQPPATQADAAVWDSGRDNDRLTADLCDFVGTLPGVPTVAVLNFPRSEDRERALACGAAEVVSKPLDVEDLLWALGRAAERPSQGASSA